MKNGRYEDSDGDVFWYKDGRLHREDGPAIAWADGTSSWWLYGVRYTEQEFNQLLAEKA